MERLEARALAKMAGAVANGGVIAGAVLKESTIDQMSTIQTRDRDYVLAVAQLDSVTTRRSSLRGGGSRGMR